jgi:hypothetical protein
VDMKRLCATFPLPQHCATIGRKMGSNRKDLARERIQRIWWKKKSHTTK